MSKVLFVCRENFGRSQVAMELYDQLNPAMAESAGTRVEHPDQRVGDWIGSKVVVQVMKEEYGVDISNNLRRQVDERLLKKFEKVIVMAEPETVPSYFADYDIERWEVPDLKARDYSTSRSIIKHIKDRVEQLAEQRQRAGD